MLNASNITKIFFVNKPMTSFSLRNVTAVFSDAAVLNVVHQVLIDCYLTYILPSTMLIMLKYNVMCGNLNRETTHHKQLGTTSVLINNSKVPYTVLMSRGYNNKIDIKFMNIHV